MTLTNHAFILLLIVSSLFLVSCDKENKNSDVPPPDFSEEIAPPPSELKHN